MAIGSQHCLAAEAIYLRSGSINDIDISKHRTVENFLLELRVVDAIPESILQVLRFSSYIKKPIILLIANNVAKLHTPNAVWFP